MRPDLPRLGFELRRCRLAAIASLCLGLATACAQSSQTPNSAEKPSNEATRSSETAEEESRRSTESGDTTDCSDCGCADRCSSEGCKSIFAGRWRGTYECIQGRTGVALTVRGPSDDITARFEFYPIPSNTKPASGAFRLKGSMECDGEFDLDPATWLDRPSGYEMVGLDGSIGSMSLHAEGTVTDARGCEAFELRRQPTSASMSGEGH